MNKTSNAEVWKETQIMRISLMTPQDIANDILSHMDYCSKQCPIRWNSGTFCCSKYGNCEKAIAEYMKQEEEIGAV